MSRDQLEHAIRAACDVSGDTEVWVFGSQAILGEHPDAPESLRMSVEADIAPKNLPDRVGIGFLVVLLGIMSSSFLHRVPIVSQVLALPLLIGAVWTHIDLTLSRRRPGRR